MDNDKKQEVRNFIKKIVLGEIKRLQQHDFHYLSFFLMSQSIELLGSFLDNKPFRARQQSHKRFAAAIQELFPAKYQRLNQNDWLYHKLRNHLAHSFLPSSWIRFTSHTKDPNAKHLSRIDKKTIFVAEEFLKDFETACLSLLDKIDAGAIKLKKMDFEGMGDFRLGLYKNETKQ